ncbi:UNVERIFIED_CONTAM: retroviral-like aspartic protease, partial [Salmonella enterica subsp. enterica serovar Weltevreden]
SEVKIFKTPPIFPAKKKKEDEDQHWLEILSKVEINLPLLEAIKQIPKCAKIMKKMCTKKMRLGNNEKVVVSANVSSVIRRKLPPKCKDSGKFAISCIIGKKTVDKVMLDLGASINLMPFSIYKELNLGPLQPTRVVIQLTDRSFSFPEGMVEDVLVKVNNLIFPADFYIIDMDDTPSHHAPHMLLRRPFMNTTKTKIDVGQGTLSFEFDGEVVSYNIFDAMTHVPNAKSRNHVNASVCGVGPYELPI